MMKSRSDPDVRQVRPLGASDADQALVLYNELTVGPPAQDGRAFQQVLAHDGTRVFGAFDQSSLISMVTLHLLPNAVWEGRPYGLIENVVTRQTHQGLGFGRLAMQAALDAAKAANAHKVMLLTGQNRQALGFYEALGFSGKDKHAMVIRYP